MLQLRLMVAQLMEAENFYKNGEFLDQPIPGRGVAFRVAAEALNVERLIFYSPDGNEDPKDILLLDDLLLDGAHLAIASRFAKEPLMKKRILRPRVSD